MSGKVTCVLGFNRPPTCAWCLHCNPYTISNTCRYSAVVKLRYFCFNFANRKSYVTGQEAPSLTTLSDIQGSFANLFWMYDFLHSIEVRRSAIILINMNEKLCTRTVIFRTVVRKQISDEILVYFSFIKNHYKKPACYCKQNRAMRNSSVSADRNWQSLISLNAVF